MKKQILAMSMIAALSGCEIDNKDSLKVPATFGNDFTTEVGFNGTEGFGFDVQLTTGHGQAAGELSVFDVNFGEAEPDYEQIPEAMYGTFTLEYVESGLAKWTYDLDETHPDVAAILDVPSATLTDALTITTLDGTKQTMNFIITGVDPSLPAEVKGALTANASIRETSAFGGVTAYDPNFDQSKFVANATFDSTTAELSPTTFDDNGKPVGILSDNGYGSLFISEQGAWEFKVNRNAKNPADETQTLLDMLPEEDSAPVADSVTLTTVDGTTVTMDVNIYGAVPNFAAEVLSTTADDSVFDVNMLNLGQSRTQTKEGKMAFKIKVTEDLTKEALFAVACSDNFHTSDDRRVATFYVQPDGELSMWSGEMVAGGDYFNDAITSSHFALKPGSTAAITKRAVFDQRLVPGEWSEFILEWKDASDTTKPKLKAWLDGEQLTSDHGAIPTDPDEYFTAQTRGGKTVVRCVNQMRFEIKPSEETGGTGAFLVDDIQFYNDRNAIPKTDKNTDKAKLNEEFANNSVGDVVKDIVVDGKTPYVHTNDSKRTTTDNVLVARD